MGEPGLRSRQLQGNGLRVFSQIQHPKKFFACGGLSSIKLYMIINMLCPYFYQWSPPPVLAENFFFPNLINITSHRFFHRGRPPQVVTRSSTSQKIFFSPCHINITSDRFFDLGRPPQVVTRSSTSQEKFFFPCRPEILWGDALGRQDPAPKFSARSFMK